MKRMPYQGNLLSKTLVIGIIFLFVVMSITPSIAIGNNQKLNLPTSNSNTLYVGGGGGDNYTTIQDAIDDANPGDTVFVYDDSSPYYENVEVDKSINLIGQNRETTVIDGSGSSNVVQISGNDVEVSGFTIRNSGSGSSNGGINIESSNNIISGNIISNNYGNGVFLVNNCFGNTINENIIEANGIGIYFVRSSGNIIRENIINQNQNGVLSFYSSNNIITFNTIEDNYNGVYISTDNIGYTINYNIIRDNLNYGVNFEHSHSSTIEANNINDNNKHGIRMYDASNNLIIENEIYQNGVNTGGGIYLTRYSNGNNIYHNNFVDNSNWNAKDECTNTWDDGSEGNYWSDYTGTDGDGDGIGDIPYPISGGDNEDRYPLMEPYGHEAQNITRKKIITIAEAYANHGWNPTEDNIYHDIYGGKRVDTPDRDTYSSWPEEVGWESNKLNIGVPYQWGGFSSLSGLDLYPQEDFDEQYTGTGAYIDVIHFAGDINYTGGECARACGVDCSGFVSRCWNLPKKESTSTLPILSNQIKYDSLKPGDILDKPYSHVILFKEYINENRTLIRTIEANGDPEVGGVAKVIEKEYTVDVSDDGLNVTLDTDITYKLYSYKFISNSPPNKPTIDGPSSGKAGIEYNYTFITEDIDYDDVYYFIDWGDESPMDWIGPYKSNEEITQNHSWDLGETYFIRCKSKDTSDAQSGWSYFEVNIPRIKSTVYPSIFYWFLERFPLLERLLNLLR